MLVLCLVDIGSNNVPGPGAYNIPTAINSTGIYVNSRFKNSLAGHFNPSYKNNGRMFSITQKALACH